MENPKIRPYLINHTKLSKWAKSKWKDLSYVVNTAVGKLKRKETDKIIFEALYIYSF